MFNENNLREFDTFDDCLGFNNFGYEESGGQGNMGVRGCVGFVSKDDSEPAVMSLRTNSIVIIDECQRTLIR